MTAIVFILTDDKGNAYMRDGSLKPIPLSTKNTTFYPLHITIGYIPNKELAPKVVSILANDPFTGATILQSKWSVINQVKMKNSIKTTVALNDAYERNTLLSNMITNFVNPLITKTLPSFKANTRDEHVEIGAENMNTFKFPNSFHLKYALSANQNIYYVYNNTSSYSFQSLMSCNGCTNKAILIEEGFIHSYMIKDHVYCSLSCQINAYTK